MQGHGRRVPTIAASKGQVTIPKEIRGKLGILPGEDLAFEERNGIFYIKKSPFDKWVGRLKKYRGQKTDEIIKDFRGT
ncbi:MAG: AbrB/MazE/SpoVT family DNA-binding domain-containing protein [Planctomycetes bacterium]|nr:AbrB/MazE/SpoVT family DNA-binding domain-containing protein [Planctomycetota bacterium]